MKNRLISCALALSTLALGGCGSEPVTMTPAAHESVTQAGVLTFATFARVLDDKTKVAEGLDIDGLDSPNGDFESCGMKDYTSPDGEPGIDNQFGGLLPVIEGFVGTENIGQLLAAAIANGQLLVLLAIDDLDDPKNDDEVTVRIAAGRGAPMLDGNGKYITYQTFGVDRETAPVSKLPGKVKDGVLHIGPGQAVLPVRVLDADFNLELEHAIGRVELTPDGGGGLKMEGTLAGGIAVEQFKEIVKGLTIGEDLMMTASNLIGLLADLDRDEETGKCTRVSAALRMETTPAFVLDE